MASVGVVFNPYTHPPEALPEAARAAEAAGVQELWLWEDCFRNAAYSAAGVALAVTSTLRVGIGIAPMPLRNAAVTAMEIATLARMFPGRLLPGLGHGVQAWMGQVGARVASPLTLMREYVPAVRALVAGERVNATGRYVSLEGVRLDWPPAEVPPVFAAAEGPKTLRLAGAVADGPVLDSKHTLAELAHAVSEVRAGRTEAGRDGEPDVVALMSTAFAAHGARLGLAAWSGGVGDGDDDGHQRMLAGTVDDVADGVQRLADIGVRRIITIAPTDEPDLAAFYANVGEVIRAIGVLDGNG
jgi:alkanesulfonate monooxygenase SsuD/methylene tetrahydromethanopterin reductase-like flavin-dependent oxidoreductase (luciferase family)